MAQNPLETKAKLIERFAQQVSGGKVDFFASAGIDFITGEREGMMGLKFVDPRCGPWITAADHSREGCAAGSGAPGWNDHAIGSGIPVSERLKMILGDFNL